MKRMILFSIASLLMTGCCSCRKTIVVVEISYDTIRIYSSVSREVITSVDRQDSLFEVVSREADRIARETMIDLIPNIR